MNATELRIGNVIMLGSVVGTVSIIEQFKGTNAINEINQDMICPILLTEEWLIKFGFELDQESKAHAEKYNWDYHSFVKNPLIEGLRTDFFRIYYYPKGRSEGSMRIWPHKKDDEYKFQIYVNQYYVLSVETVHQFQNLYFTLTGKELTIKS